MFAEADWARLVWRHLSSLPTRSLAGSEKRSRVGSRAWRAADLLQSGPVNLAAHAISTKPQRPALFSRCTCEPRLRMSGNMEKLWVETSSGATCCLAVSHLWPPLRPLGEIAAKIITFYGEHPFFSETFTTHIIIINWFSLCQSCL